MTTHPNRPRHTHPRLWRHSNLAPFWSIYRPFWGILKRPSLTSSFMAFKMWLWENFWYSTSRTAAKSRQLPRFRVWLAFCAGIWPSFGRNYCAKLANAMIAHTYMACIDISAIILGDFIYGVGQTSTESGRHPKSTQPLQRPNITNLWETNLEKHTTM